MTDSLLFSKYTNFLNVTVSDTNQSREDNRENGCKFLLGGLCVILHVDQRLKEV